MLDQITEDLMASKPSRRYIAQAMLAGPTPEDGYYAVWAAPGMIPDYVYFRNPKTGEITPRPTKYRTEAEALSAARSTLIGALNNRAETKLERSSKPAVSKKMTGAQLAVALAEADISPTEFAQMWGTSVERLMSMMDDEQDVPFPMRWALELLKLPGAIELVVKIVDENIVYKPKWLLVEARRDRLNQLKGLIEPRLPPAGDETSMRYGAAVTSGMPARDVIRQLELIANELGITIPPATADSPATG